MLSIGAYGAQILGINNEMAPHRWQISHSTPLLNIKTV